MASVRELARQVNVSRTTVSRVVNNDPSVSDATRRKVLQAINRANYAPAIGRRVTTMIGYVHTRLLGRVAGNPYAAELIDGIHEGAGGEKFDMVILDMHRDKSRGETYTQFFSRKGVRGIVVRTNLEDRHICRMIAQEGFPMVVVSERFDEADINYVGFDSLPGTHQAVSHLIGLGHRRIAFARSNQPTRDESQRQQGYLKALQDASIAADPNLVFRYAEVTAEAGASLVNQLTALADPVTALVLADTVVSVGALNRAHELGIRVPGDLSIIGFDEARTRYQVFPKMSAVCQDPRMIGRLAARHLVQSILGPSKTLQKLIPTTFEAHGTTGPAET